MCSYFVKGQKLGAMIKVIEMKLTKRFRRGVRKLSRAIRECFPQRGVRERALAEFGYFKRLACRKLFEDSWVVRTPQKLPEGLFTEPPRDLAAQWLPYVPRRAGKRRSRGAKKFNQVMTSEARDQARRLADRHFTTPPSWMPEQKDVVWDVALRFACLTGRLPGYTNPTGENAPLQGREVKLIRACLGLLYGDDALKERTVVGYLQELRHEFPWIGHTKWELKLTDEVMKEAKIGSDAGLTALIYLKGLSPVPIPIGSEEDTGRSWTTEEILKHALD